MPGTGLRKLSFFILSCAESLFLNAKANKAKQSKMAKCNDFNFFSRFLFRSVLKKTSIKISTPHIKVLPRIFLAASPLLDGSILVTNICIVLFKQPNQRHTVFRQLVAMLPPIDNASLQQMLQSPVHELFVEVKSLSHLYHLTCFDLLMLLFWKSSLKNLDIF